MINFTNDFPWQFARLPARRSVVEQISQASVSLCKKLRSLDVSTLDISDYNRKYLSGKIKEIERHIKTEGYILALAMPRTPVSFQELSFLEYGGGTGLQAMLARELGIGSVVYNDIYDVSCHDARVIANAVVGEADHYILGDIKDVIAYSGQHALEFDAVSSYDVIEHVYDIGSFLKALGDLPGARLRVAHGSGANPFNELYVAHVTKTQLEHESTDREKRYGHKARDTLRSFLEVRRDMIRACDSELSPDQVELLAERTRGKIQPDIARAVENFTQHDIVPEPPAHPTNTCDPYTGNWAEHLMDPFSLADQLASAGFRTQVMGTFCTPFGESATAQAKANVKNLMISLWPRAGLRHAQAYILVGQRN